MGAARPGRAPVVTPESQEEAPPPDPPVAAWERDTGLRWGERVAMRIMLDRRSGACPRRTAAALAPVLRQMTVRQLGLAARALDRMTAAESGRAGASGA